MRIANYNTTRLLVREKAKRSDGVFYANNIIRRTATKYRKARSVVRRRIVRVNYAQKPITVRAPYVQNSVANGGGVPGDGDGAGE